MTGERERNRRAPHLAAGSSSRSAIATPMRKPRRPVGRRGLAKRGDARAGYWPAGAAVSAGVSPPSGAGAPGI
jgi:hypothetical protein